MRKTLQQKLTGSILVAIAAALAITAVCLLFGMARYSSAQFETQTAEVLTTELLEEMNTAATGSAESAAAQVEDILSAYAGQLRLGAGRSYSVWDATNGERVAGDESAVVTDNIVTAMNGAVGDAFPLLPTKMDIAVPISGETPLILDIQDDGSDMRGMLGNLALLLLAGAVLALLAGFLISRILARAFTSSAVETANMLRENQTRALAPSGDWEALAAALSMQEPRKKKRGAQEESALDLVLPYLSEGYVLFDTSGRVRAINRAAERLLGATADEKTALKFDQLFPGVPIPTEEQRMLRGRLTTPNGTLLITFTALEPGVFAAIIAPADGGAA